MTKNIKDLFYFISIFIFIFFVVKFYFSKDNKIKTQKLRSIYLNKIDNELSKLPMLLNDTADIIEYIDNYDNQINNQEEKEFRKLIDE
jgi:hypothetical protein